MGADPPVFIGCVDDEGAIHLDFPKQQRAYCKRWFAGQRVDVIIAPYAAMKTRRQEQGFWAMIAPWAREGGHAPDDLKNDLLREIFGLREHANAISGEITMVLREPHTSKLSKAQYSELIERTLEIAAECGYVLEAPNEYRERQLRRRHIHAYRVPTANGKHPSGEVNARTAL